jgi:hypothetical protein
MEGLIFECQKYSNIQVGLQIQASCWFGAVADSLCLPQTNAELETNLHSRSFLLFVQSLLPCFLAYCPQRVYSNEHVALSDGDILTHN